MNHVGNSKLVIVTITGIRPDFIRMSEVFKKLDENFHHILIHTGQHTDKLLSDVFFQELNIREPDYLLSTKEYGNEHYQQLSYMAIKVIELFRTHHIKPDLILFLGDSNSVCVSMILKKEGYKIGHIEAGMRSYDKRMLEEINRTVCDHCSDILFVYNQEYRDNLIKENITQNIYVVGNTITEVFNKFLNQVKCVDKTHRMILLDIHRPENFKDEIRLRNIIRYANLCGSKYKLPVLFLNFSRTMQYIQNFNIDLDQIQIIDLLPYSTYLDHVYHSKFIISDSGTAQEEPALLYTPVIVPRDYTERPLSMQNNCSYMLNVNTTNSFDQSFTWLEHICQNPNLMQTKWLGDGNTSDLIIDYIKKYLYM